MVFDCGVELLSRLLDGFLGVADAAVFFLMLSLLLNAGDLSKVWRGFFCRGLKINVASYAFDLVFVLAPLSALLDWSFGVLSGFGFVLIPYEWYSALPDALVVFLVVFVGDAVGYFRHRLEHARFLWPSHALHHSDDEMSWFTLFRFHPINRVTTVMLDGMALFVLGFPLWAIIVGSLVRHYYGMLIHANVPWTYGALGKVFVSPVMHRWHHVARGRGVYSNYATIFSIFDRAFGTYYVPGVCCDDLGVDGVTGGSFFRQILYPIREVKFFK